MLLIIMSDIKEFMAYNELSQQGTETYIFDLDPSVDVCIIDKGTDTKSGNPCLALETEDGVRYRLGAMSLLNAIISEFTADNPILWHDQTDGMVKYNETEWFNVRAKEGTITIQEAGYEEEVEEATVETAVAEPVAVVKQTKARKRN